jgi:hypothetical protein
MGPKSSRLGSRGTLGTEFEQCNACKSQSIAQGSSTPIVTSRRKVKRGEVDQLHPLLACDDYDVTGGKDVTRRGSATCSYSVESTHHHPIVTRADIRGVLAN